jgi:hypothetical protein
MTTIEKSQTIYVDSEWVTKFVQFFIDQGLKYNVEHEKDEKAALTISTNFNLREELPTHLRGKFTMFKERHL